MAPVVVAAESRLALPALPQSDCRLPTLIRLAVEQEACKLKRAYRIFKLVLFRTFVWGTLGRNGESPSPRP